MVTREDCIDYLRTLVSGDYAVNEHLERKFDAQGWEAYTHYLKAAYFLAVDRRFKHPADAGEIMVFVAGMQTELEGSGLSLDMQLAEAVILSVLDESTCLNMYTVDQEILGRILALATLKSLTEADLSAQELDDILREAGEAADRNPPTVTRSGLVTRIAGDVDQSRLETLRETLWLQPRGRITDDRDQIFGVRVDEVDHGCIQVLLFRDDGAGWWEIQVDTRGRFEGDVIALAEADVRTAVEAAGLSVESVRLRA